ncbi:DUF2628 domain-containing protein [Sphaerotilaceae bacterium SBD11-9]
MTEPTHPTGDFVPVAVCADPTEAHLLKETLAAAGILATVADASFAQANPWMTSASGGVRVLVPTASVADAKETIASVRAGAFQLESAADGAGDESPAASDPKANTYVLYSHDHRKPAIVAVKKGFSWPAFLVGPLWFLLNGMWMSFLLSASFIWGAPAVIRLLGASHPGEPAAHLPVVYSVFFAIWVFTGLVANFLLGEELKRKGYVAGPPVRARSTGEAIDVYRPRST